MSPLVNFVIRHTTRGACTCGRCADAGGDPEKRQPTGHTADLIFFKVAAKDDPNADELRKLIKEHGGDFNQCDPCDGQEHNYLELGGWIGDQSLALMLMGLGTVLGLWDLLTPRTMLGESCTDEIAQQMAGAGYVAIQAYKKP